MPLTQYFVQIPIHYFLGFVEQMQKSLPITVRIINQLLESSTTTLSSGKHSELIFSMLPLVRVLSAHTTFATAQPTCLMLYGAVSTFHDDNICKTRFSMLCLELTTANCSQ